jgi:glycerol-3-phosphate dehydrogenase
VRWALAEETPQLLEDLIYRRLRAAWFAPGERDRLLAPAAALMGEALGWSQERQGAEIDRVRARLAQELAFKGLALAPKAVA